MINLPKLKLKDKRTALDREIDRVLENMEFCTDQYSQAYKTKIDVLEKLIKLRDSGKCTESVRIEKLNPNTIAIVVGGLIELLLIMNYENLHVISTKAFSRMLRGRV